MPPYLAECWRLFLPILRAFLPDPPPGSPDPWPRILKVSTWLDKRLQVIGNEEAESRGRNQGILHKDVIWRSGEEKKRANPLSTNFAVEWGLSVDFLDFDDYISIFRVGNIASIFRGKNQG